MTITLTNGVNVTTLCAGQTRNATGDPVGPRDLRIVEAPGVAAREYVGADRVEPEHIRCNSGTISFGVTRTYASVAAALTYITTTMWSEDVAGQLKFDDTAIFGARSCITQRSVVLDGASVHLAYTIVG